MTGRPRPGPGTEPGTTDPTGDSPYATDRPEDTMDDTASQQRTHQPLTYPPPGHEVPAYQPPLDGTPPAHEPAPVPEAEGPAVGTLVWGLTVLAVATLVVLWELTDVRVELSVVVPAAMLGLGLVLVVGAVLSGLRRRA